MLMASKKSSKGVGLDGEESPGHVVSMQTEDLHLEKSTAERVMTLFTLVDKVFRGE